MITNYHNIPNNQFFEKKKNQNIANKNRLKYIKKHKKVKDYF